jgi:S-adenosylmethionine hydrolase
VRVGEAVFVGPDNGVLSLAIEAQRARAAGATPRAFHLNNARYWLPRVSTTFHGRDIFSPCAAHLSLGVRLEEIGAPVDDWIALTPPKPVRRKDGSLLGHVIYVDRYGNIVSDITEEALKEFGTRDVSVEIAGREIHGLVRTYSDVEPEEFAALIGSPWKLEIAQREANAAEALGVFIGDELVVRHSREG